MEPIEKFQICDSVQVSGICLGCGAYHAGKLMLKINTFDGLASLEIGTEGQGDDTFHTLATIPVKAIPGSSSLNLGAPVVIQ